VSRQSAQEAIAIIGVGLRLPGAGSLDEFWAHLAAGRSLISEVPAGRWDKAALRGNPAQGNKTGSIWGGFVDDADCFDAAFFNISPREAAWMDPQQRFALELAWQAIEDGGYRASALAGSRTGVYMGVCHWDYAELLEKHLAQVDAYTPTGIAFSIIANRVSHFFDLRGPSIANDTACAASLTSVYEAVRALQAGECDLALAGGVNLIWSPNHFVAFSKNGMLSRTGQSKAFDAAADGYVRGEGGAMLLLKPLAQAQADGDPIHGVIRGIGVNHGGRTNSLTVTNPQAQAALIAGVIREAGVAPDSISYIEAHGTGTPLGDPIEIAGLKQAFAALYEEAGRSPVADSCGIGSVKTNIGHLEGAAGVAGLVKVLAALEHQALPANANFAELNSLIDLAGTPFRIQDSLAAWPITPGQPRRAGVSAFGFGGSNGHVLLEEAPFAPPSADFAGPFWLPLAARDDARLRANAAALAGFLAAEPVRLADLAWTLQSAREAMASRLLLRVADLADLAAALAAFLAGRSDSRVWLAAPGAAAGEPGPAEPMASQWLSGATVDWRQLYGAELPRRLHAPTYVFARERHWMDLSLGAKDPEPFVHPLVQRNVSQLGRQRYQATFSGREFFWAGHLVGGVQILPGVTCLEMARAAWALATGREGEAALHLVIDNLLWSRPLPAGEAPVTVDISLQPQAAEQLAFAIENRALPGVNAEGSIRPAMPAVAEVLDLADWRARATSRPQAADLYARLRASGMVHGANFQTLGELYRGAGYLLASLKLPRHWRASLESFRLHPLLLDGAIQAWIGLEEEGGGRSGAAVPFACRRVEVFAACSESMWALLTPIPGKGDGSLRRFDITLCNGAGQVCLRFHELALRLMAEPAGAAELLLSTPHWEACPQRPAVIPAGRQSRLLLAPSLAALAEPLAALSGLPVTLLPAVEPAGSAARAWYGVLQAELQAALAERRKPRQHWLVVLPAGAEELPGAALAALLRSAAAEQPKFSGALLWVAGELSAARLAALVASEASGADSYTEIRYDAADERQVCRPQVLLALPADGPRSPGADGVVWISGGQGGLGRHFLTWLAARGVRQVVLAGRRPAAGAAIEPIDGLSIHYRPCDVAVAEQVVELVGWIERDIGPLRGVIHAAGVLRDAYLLQQQAADVDAVFAPKVAGLLNIDVATQHCALDFFVLCSSIAATFGNPGQSSYAAANACLDAWAETRHRQVAAGQRQGRTLAVAWPLWAAGGMTVEATTRAALQRRFGTLPLPTGVALETLERLLNAPEPSRVTVQYGPPGRLQQVIAEYGADLADSPPAAPALAAAPGDHREFAGDTLRPRVIDWLKDLLGELIQMDPARLRANRQLAEYGLDSIVIVEMTSRMEASLGPLAKTLFFEYVDLDGVAGHLLESHGAALNALLGGGEAALAAAGEAPTPAAPDSPAAAAGLGEHDIAIVGLSLHVAGADDQESFWQMLEQGLHGFRRYPPERWNHEALVHPERDVLGKTVVQTGAFMNGIDLFDPRYFRISQAEAELMSPEVRLFLQSCVEAFEDAGYSRETLQREYGGEVAVIVGSMTNDYNLYGFQNMLQRGALASGSYTGTVPNMVSYYYGFTGPSYFLDTMCSAAATCVHEAVHMLRSGRSQMALAGGISLLLHPQKLIATSQEHFTSKSAEVIRGYGLGADGTILGEGVGALVMKRLADAERDGDRIYGVIKGSAVSNAGVRNGFTVPNPRQQAVAIEKALLDSGIEPASIGYIEGHGSGTALGDPIEVRALSEAYGPYFSQPQVCPLGTVKSNVAHLLGAAALPGIVKVLLQMQHGKLAPSLHAATLNPNIPFAQTPFYVQRELTDWPRKKDAAGREWPRRAGVTSIGAGGMNAHLILEEYRPPAPLAGGAGNPVLGVFSAMSSERLRAVLERFCTHLEAHPDLPLADLAWTLQVGRNELPCRLALVISDQAQLLQRLRAFLAADSSGGAANLFYTPSILDCDPQVAPAQLEQALAERQLAQLAAWWSQGVSIAWPALYGAARPRRLALPAYPFEKVRCWYQEYPDAPSVVHPLGATRKLHPFVGSNHSDLQGLCYRTPIYLNELLDYVYTEARQPRLLPTAVVEMMAAVASLAGCATGFSLVDLEVGQAVDWAAVKTLTAEVTAAGSDLQIELTVELAAGHRLPLAGARVLRPSPDAAPPVWREAVPPAAGQALSGEQFYQQLAAAQWLFKPYLEVVESVRHLPQGGVLCQLLASHPEQDPFKRHLLLPPRLLGALWQALLLVEAAAARSTLGRLGRLYLAAGHASQLLLRPAPMPALWDALFLDADGQVVAACQGLALHAAADLGRPAALPLTPPGGRAAAVEAAARLTLAPVTEAAAAAMARYSRDLRQLVGQLLKFDAAEISPRSPFYDLGFDSISLTRLANEINGRYGSNLTPAIFYECEHIEALAAWLARRWPVAADGGAEAAVETAVETAPRSALPGALPLGRGVPGATPGAPDAAIAIIGLAARLPGCSDAADFFQHLLAGDDLLGDLPLERYPPAYRERLVAAGFPLRGGFLSDIDRFDAAFFKISPHEAERLDPQQRLVLETVYRTLENAGYAADELPAETGVFVGVSGRDYGSLLQAHGVDSDGYVATGNSLAMVANRVSWHFDLQGPSEAVDTACSSSLVALLRAAEAIRSGRCRLALVAGVNLALALEGFTGPWQAGMLSPSGRCQTFSRAADGYVRGEGVVALLLKGRAAAEHDGDRILGLLAGGAENHGGHAGSLTAPNTRAQAELVCQAMAGIPPASIGYIEAHGTGTSLGDPVEINGLRLAYGRLEEGAAPHIGLGSVKSNIGHLEAAAGLAGVLKVLLALQAEELPPTLHCAEINPYLELSGSPFYLVRERQPWRRPVDAAGRPLARRAGVSSFGFGGSNAHVVLEEYPAGPRLPRRQPLPARPFAATRYWLPQAAAETVLLAPRWEDQPVPAGTGPAASRRRILPCEFALPAATPGLIAVPQLSGDLGQRYGALASLLLQTLQGEAAAGLDGELLLQLLVPADDERSVYAGLGALLDSARAENPRLVGQVIALPGALAAGEVLALLAAEARQPQARRVRYQAGRRQLRVWRDLPPGGPGSADWRPAGVYLISGGLGALGRRLATEIARQAPGATLVLVGRGELDAARQRALDELRQAGARLDYRPVDITDASAVTALVEDIRRRYGALHGVIHCAGIHRDSALIRKTPEQLAAVLAPKVAGVLALEQACRGLPLDCFILFSSLAGAVGNAGQTDYAAANGFLDALAEWRGAPLQAIDWPLWREGGMHVSPAGEQAFFETMGQRPLATAAGLAALAACRRSAWPQVAVIGGDGRRIREFFQSAAGLGSTPDASPARTENQAGPAEAADDLLRQRVGQALGGLLGRLAGLSAGQILLDEPLENYGIDSLLINRLNRELGEHFASLSKTLFFEYRTLAQVATHLAERQAAACRRWLGLDATERPAIAAPAPAAALRRATPVSGEPPEAIAIIGLSGSYPGAPTLAQFWANLVAGRESIGEIPAERWAVDEYYDADPERAIAGGLSYARRGGFLEGFADFDPAFFRLSPREAAAMDPQERLFLMQAWAACEDAGYTRARFASQHASRVGVFVGVSKTGYELHGAWQSENGARVRPVTSFASVANRVSSCLDLKGPSLPVDTMCSSSLTAIHLACAQLRQGECDVALAGGVNLYLHPDNYAALCAARMLSADGHCRSFGAGGKGFVPGEGVGCLVLKPLSAALADGDRIHGLIRGSAVNHGGRTAGYTVPDPLAQAAVVQAALRQAGVESRAISYVEAHGTGTELGDPIEFNGLRKAFGEGLPAAQCALGSVKSGIGHLEAAAGIAGLTKVLLQMRHRQLVPSLHAETINPNLDFSGSPFRLQRQLAPWPAPAAGLPRLAGVSSFGAGGANAHLIVEEWPTPSFPLAAETHLPAAGPQPQAIVLSARDGERLREAAQALHDFVVADGPAPRAGAPVAAGEIRRLVAEILAVDADQLDVDESLDAYGFEPIHRHALGRALEQHFNRPLALADLAGGPSISQLAALLGEPAAAVTLGEGGLDLADLAWTLQVGREAMDQRLALVAATPAELLATLQAWLQAAEGEAVAGVWRGSASAQRGSLGLLAGEPDLLGLIERWLGAGEMARVLGLWVLGLDIDWRRLPRPRPPRIVSAPTYPFARQRYWLPLPPRAGAARLVQLLAEEAEGREELQRQHDELERQLARLLPACLAGAGEGDNWQRWRVALDALLAARGVAPASETTAWAEWAAYRARLEATPGPLAQVRLVDTVLRALPDILANRQPATAIMFPAGRLELVEAVYKQNAVAARFNATLARAAAAFVAQRRATGGRLRILEIGAGTGGTSAAVLEALAPYRDAVAEYRYTDLSRAFLIHGERHFAAAHPALRTALFDVEKPLAGQDVEAGAYDLVIAANVLHATRQMTQSMAQVGALLAPGGLLLINETSCATLFTHLTFGLLEGWWRFTDGEWRIPGSPALTAASWRRLVEAGGLLWVGGSSAAEQALGQQVLAAQRPAGELPAPPVRPPPAPSPTADPVASPAGLGQRVVAALAATLNVASGSIDATLSFADYGLDSILGAELVDRLRQELGIRLAQTDLFDYPSAQQLTAFLERQGGAALAAALAAEPAAASPGWPAAARAPQPSAPPAPIASAAPASREPIAIVGFSGRFAGSDDAQQLWQHLLAGDDLVRPVSRFDLAPFYREAAPGSWCNHGSFIDGIEQFDARFFNISGLEATYMDPQQRLFLQEAWRTLEQAGHAGADIEGRRCGVFVGCAHGDYQELFASQPPGQAFWGNTCSLIPARIAYHLNLKGPAVAVDTACSSSLVAVHLACHSLWQGESEMALAGGVFIQSSARFYRYANQAQMLSPSGRCAAFGAAADGIVPGEAVGAVLLRPLSQALADGDSIHGLIVATGINQDGATNGITAPSALSQEQLIRDVYRQYGIDPGRIAMLEAHGTGTPLGDPIEFAALRRAYEDAAQPAGYCALGSIKSNLGHATTAAGVAGLIKVLLALQHEKIPPTLHAEPANPALALADSPFLLNSRPLPWPVTAGRPRQAAISSFGFGGTNAHLVVEEGPPPAAPASPATAWLLPLSARSAEQLRRQAAALLAHLASQPTADCAAMAYTLCLGRRHFAHRLVVVAGQAAELQTRLAGWLAGQADSGAFSGELAGPPAAAQQAAGQALPARLAAALHGEAATYRRLLDELGRLFLAGCDELLGEQFPGGRGQRVALPTYPFAGQSYWVTKPPVGDSPAPAVRAMPAPAAAAGGPAASSRRLIRLGEPEELAGSGQQPGRPLPRVSLAPLAAAPVSGRLLGLGTADGVRHWQIVGPWNDDLLAELAAALDAAGGDPTVRVVLLSGDWQAAPGARPASGGLAAPLRCPLPVVAALPAAHGSGLGLAAHADFLVLAEGGRYGGAPAAAAPLLRRRFGRAMTERLLADGAGTAELPSGLPRRTAEQVVAGARELAQQLAGAPRPALVELKRHMRQGPQVPTEWPPADPWSLDFAAPSAAEADALAGRGAGQRLALATPVMELELLADGVVVLHMQERQHKNTFTPAFMAGLQEAFDLIERTPACKVVVLTGHAGYFACGGTRAGLESLQRGASHFTDQRIYSLPLSCPLPVIAALQGHAIGAGWSLGMFCDRAVYAADSVYHSNYLWYGFTPGAGATLAFPQRLGDDLGREVLFSARPYKGRELAQRLPALAVFPAAEVLPRALAAAHRLAGASRPQLVAAKAAATAAWRGQLEAVLARELAMHEITFIGNPRVLERIASSFPELPPPAAAAPVSPGPERRAALRQVLVTTLGEELLIAPGEIGDAAGFLELGLDSILALTWIRRLNRELAIELPATAVYAQPTVGALLERVLALVPAPAAAVSQVAPPPATHSPAAQPAVAAPGHLRQILVSSLAEELLLPADEISDRNGFLELGLDSILALTWIRKLNQQLGIALPATCVYAHPTFGALLAEVGRLLPGAALAVAPAPQPPAEVVQDVVEPPAAGRPADPEAIAIIGAAGRFPMAADLPAFWENISNGRDCISEIPPSRWDIARHYDADPQAPGKSNSKWMGAIDDIDLFDAAFFNITAREAELMDPQQRLFLQHAWQAIEDAAIDPLRLAGARCGVFVGSGNSGYGELISETNAYSLIGSASSILAARLSYLLDLRGPCIALDTACSTSLVAIAEACNSLLAGNSDLALAGGACVMLGPKMHIDTSKVGMLSPDGRCYSFDQRANGFVPGEGVGVLLLKRLADAERDGDPIRAVIRGWGMNQDGRTNGITAPNPVAQGELLQAVYRRFAIAPGSIGLVETHGTGTPLGDPIEIEGLRAGFAPFEGVGQVAIGSVKSNVGHLLAAAGVAGAIKAMLALEHGELPPSIHFERQNEHLALAGSPFYVNTRRRPWPASAGLPRRAAVSAFGFSGTNAHLVLEEYAPARPAAEAPTTPSLCLLSARSTAQLAAQAASLAAFVEATPGLEVADFCSTLQVGRSAFECRAAFVCTEPAALLRQLRAVAGGESAPGVVRSPRQNPAAPAFASTAEGRQELDKWLAGGQLDDLAEAWCQGCDIDWSRLLQAGRRRRLRLPGYSFARQRHWLKPAAPARLEPPAERHPLLGQGPGLSFAGSFRGDEVWLSPLWVAGERLLPGLFYPEMARAAGELASGRPVVGLRHLVWGRPLCLNGAARRLTVLPTAQGSDWLYRICADGDDAVCQVGELLFAEAAGAADNWPALPAPGSGRDCTAAFRRTAPAGPGLLEVVRCGTWLGGRWRHPGGEPALPIDPRLLAAVWQLVAFHDSEQGRPGPRLPLALESLRHVAAGAAAEEVWIWLQPVGQGSPALQVQVVDLEGRPRLYLEGLVSEQLGALSDLLLLAEESV